MPEILDEASSIESTTVGVFRTSATVKGGRRFSFGALVVVGDRKGRVGFGYGKSNEVPQAVEKAQKYAKRAMSDVPMAGRTLPHEVEGKFGASKVRLIPASPGTGVVAGSTIRAILEMAGITDCLTKCYGNTNSFNIVKACFDGIDRLRKREEVADARGVKIDTTEIEKKIEKGKAFVSTAKGEKMKGPVNTIGQERRGGRGGGGGRGGRGGRAGRDAGRDGGQSAPAGDGASGGGAPQN
ncbi:MAG: 30S ribosomal protein S5 [Phycisphaeraceae bacterium]|nr:30S ribosomal protein S5 [Phycisphaeraceae bacterium]